MKPSATVRPNELKARRGGVKSNLALVSAILSIALTSLSIPLALFQPIPQAMGVSTALCCCSILLTMFFVEMVDQLNGHGVIGSRFLDRFELVLFPILFLLAVPALCIVIIGIRAVFL